MRKLLFTCMLTANIGCGAQQKPATTVTAAEVIADACASTKDLQMKVCESAPDSNECLGLSNILSEHCSA